MSTYPEKARLPRNLSDTPRKKPDYPGKSPITPEFVRLITAKPLLVVALRDPTKGFTNKVYKQEQIYLQKGNTAVVWITRGSVSIPRPQRGLNRGYAA